MKGTSLKMSRSLSLSRASVRISAVDGMKEKVVATLAIYKVTIPRRWGDFIPFFGKKIILHIADTETGLPLFGGKIEWSVKTLFNGK